MAVSETIARLMVSLGMETAAFASGAARNEKRASTFQRNISKVSGAVKTALAGMVGAFALSEIGALAQKGLEYASSLGEVASQLGVTTKALQEYRYAASQAGIEQGEMDQALSQLTRRIGDAAQGSKPLQVAFEKLGVDIRDANGHVRDAGEVIPLIAEGLQKIESPAERAAILVDLFGKSGQKLAPLLEGGAAGVNNLRDAAQKLGIVLSDKQIQNADDTADKLSAIKQVLEAKIAGAVANNTESILALADALVELVDAAGKAAKAWSYFARLDWSPGAGSFSQQFERMALDDLGPGVELTRAPTPLELAAIARNKAPKPKAPAVDQRFLGGMGTTLTLPKRAPGPKQTPWGPTVQPGLSRAVGSSVFGGLDFSNYAPGSGSSDWLAAANDTYGNLAQLSAEVAEKNKEAWKALAEMASEHGPRLEASLKKLAPEMEALRAATQGILDRLFPEEGRFRQYTAEMATLTAAMKDGQLSSENYAKAMTALRHEWIGFTDELAKNTEILSLGVGPSIEEMSQAISDRLPEAFKIAGDEAEAMRVRVEESFAQMASRIGNAIAQLIGGKTGRIIGAIVDIGSAFAGAFGGSGRLPAFANGTSFAPGGLSLVGERGPELVDLPRGARVTPNNDLRRLGGNTYYINGNLLTPEFWAQIQAGDVGAARAGAAGGVASLQKTSRRRY